MTHSDERSAGQTGRGAEGLPPVTENVVLTGAEGTDRSSSNGSGVFYSHKVRKSLFEPAVVDILRSSLSQILVLLAARGV